MIQNFMHVQAVNGYVNCLRLRERVVFTGAVGHWDVAALLVPPDNSEALADALIELLEDLQLREAPGQPARQ